MTLNLQNLRGDEIPVFKTLVEKYLEYDKIDLIIHKTLKVVGTSKEDFINRKIVIEKEPTNRIIQLEASQLNRFCDGDKCEIPMLLNEKC